MANCRCTALPAVLSHPGVKHACQQLLVQPPADLIHLDNIVNGLSHQEILLV